MDVDYSSGLINEQQPGVGARSDCLPRFRANHGPPIRRRDHGEMPLAVAL